MSNKDIFKYGEEILNSINKAAEAGDFSNLSRDVKNSINEAASTFSSTIGKEIRTGLETGLKSSNFNWRKGEWSPFFSVKINKRRGIGKIVGGSILVLMGILGGGGIGVGCIIGGGLLLLTGKRNRRLIKDYFSFGDAIGTNSYITVRELSDKTAKTAEYIVNQIKRMKEAGYLPYATMDKAETTLMLTDEVYKQYLMSAEYNANKQKYNSSKKAGKGSKNGKDAKDDKEVKESAATKNVSMEEGPANVSYYVIDENLPEDVQSILRDGNDYLNEIRYFNDLIPDTEIMSDKLYTLEATALSIFKRLKEAPDIAGDLRKFMSYYLPTTKKLLQSYVNLRKMSLNVENIAKSQKEIEEATDVINDAFVKLLNQLFETDSWDISSEISVMKTMMKQDALL